MHTVDMSKAHGILSKISYWLFIAFLVYLIFELVRKLLGGSLGIEDLILAGVIANLGFSFHINSKLAGHLGWHKGKDSKK